MGAMEKQAGAAGGTCCGVVDLARNGDRDAPAQSSAASNKVDK